MFRHLSFFRISFFASCLTLVGVAFLSGCKESTGPLTAEESIRKVLTPALLDTLKKLGMVINEGDMPPTIEGSFYADKKRLKGSNVASDTVMRPFSNTSLKFSGQTADQHIHFEYQQGSGSGEGYGAIITGSGDLFTVYVEASIKNTRHDTTINSVEALCYSGRIAADGIHDMTNATLITRKNDPDPTSIVLAVGQGRVIFEADSLAVRVTDYPHDTTTAAAKTGAHTIAEDANP